MNESTLDKMNRAAKNASESLEKVSNDVLPRLNASFSKIGEGAKKLQELALKYKEE